MAWPTIAVVTTGMDADTDNIPRSDILDLTTKFNDVIAARAAANGVCELDAASLVPVSRIPTSIARLTLTGNQAINEARANITMDATLMNLWAGPSILDGTGTAPTITSMVDAPQAGARRVLYPTPGSVLTHGATFDIDGNVNRTAAAGERWEFIAKSGSVNTFRVHVTKDDGTPVDLTNSGVTPGTYGGATAVPVITFDAKGRATVCSTAAISSTPPANSVGQAQLRAASGSVSVVNQDLNLVLPGGAYGFYPRIEYLHPGTLTTKTTSASLAFISTESGIGDSSGPQTFIHLSHSSPQVPEGYAIAYQQYVTASPPYNLGNGDIPLFIFAMVDSATGKIAAAYVAPDPCWAYNGPTDIRPDYIDPETGKKYKIRKDESSLPNKFKNKKPKGLALAELDQYLDLRKNLPTVLVEIDQALKQADMPLIPHPFITQNLTGKTVIIFEPIGSMIERLTMMHDDGDNVAELLHGNYLAIDNVPLIGMNTPPTVKAHRVSWKL